MTITETEFENNFEKYLAMVGEQDFYIIRDGKIIAKLTAPDVDVTEQQHGSSPGTTSFEAEVTRNGAEQAFRMLRAEAKLNGVSDMPLDDINEEISEARK